MVVCPKPSKLDYEFGLGALVAMIPGLISMMPSTLPNTSDIHRDINEDVEAFREQYDLLTQRLCTEDVWEAAVAVAAEEIKRLPTETEVPERSDILVKHLRFDEAELTPRLKEALEAAFANENWLSMLSAVRKGIDQAFRFGSKVVSGAPYLLPVVSLIGMVGALPLASGSDEVTAVKIGTVGASDWSYNQGVGVVGMCAAEVLMMFYLAQAWREAHLTPQEEWLLRGMIPFGFFNQIVGQPPQIIHPPVHPQVPE